MKTTIKQIKEAQNLIDLLEQINHVIRNIGGNHDGKYVSLNISIGSEDIDLNNGDVAMDLFLHDAARRILDGAKDHVLERLNAFGIEIEEPDTTDFEPRVVKKKKKKKAKKKACKRPMAQQMDDDSVSFNGEL